MSAQQEAGRGEPESAATSGARRKQKPPSAPVPEGELAPDLVAALDQHGVAARDEVGLRRALERHLPGYTLYRLLPAAARRWKCRYRIMFGATYFDCQTVPEAYARALLAALDAGHDATHNAQDTAEDELQSPSTSHADPFT